MKVQRLKVGIFCYFENNNNKNALGLLVHLGDKSFTNQTLHLNLTLDLFSKDKFLFGFSYLLSVSMNVFQKQPRLFSWLIAIETL